MGIPLQARINYKKLHISFILIFFIFFTGQVFSLEMSNVIAYPVPFNPHVNNIINIGIKKGTSISSFDKVSIEIYDINGDSVFSGNFSTSSLPIIIWNGRNSKGNMVRPGLYIIKVIIENSSNGDYGKKLIRILVTG